MKTKHSIIFMRESSRRRCCPLGVGTPSGCWAGGGVVGRRGRYAPTLPSSAGVGVLSEGRITGALHQVLLLLVCRPSVWSYDRCVGDCERRLTDARPPRRGPSFDCRLFRGTGHGTHASSRWLTWTGAEWGLGWTLSLRATTRTTIHKLEGRYMTVLWWLWQLWHYDCQFYFFNS